MEFIKKIGKSENGSITVYVLSTLMVVLLVTTTIYVGLRNKTTTQIKQMDKINKEYNVTENDMQEAYDKAILETLESVKGTETTNTTVKDNLGNKVVVPAGFKVINPTENVTNGIENGAQNMSNKVESGTQNSMNGAYNATRTSVDTQAGTFMGMNSTAWTWLIMAIAAIAIVALVWYYGTQRQSSHYDDR